MRCGQARRASETSTEQAREHGNVRQPLADERSGRTLERPSGTMMKDHPKPRKATDPRRAGMLSSTAVVDDGCAGAYRVRARSSGLPQREPGWVPCDVDSPAYSRFARLCSRPNHVPTSTARIALAVRV